MTSGASFYGSIPVFRGFTSLMDPALYAPLPDDWSIGVADIVDSTKAIAAQRYKAVNMAGAAVIAAVTNALEGREFPFVFGGDGASFAVAPADLECAARGAGCDRDLGAGRSRSEDARRAGAGQRHPRAGPRRARRALRSVGQFVLCDVLRRRARLGRRRDEARRVRGRRSARRHAARSLRPVLPLRGDAGRARPDPVGAGDAGARRRPIRLSAR